MKFKKNQSGQGTTEYILIVALIAVAVIVAVKLFGTSTDINYKNLGNTANNVPNNTSGH